MSQPSAGGRAIGVYGSPPAGVVEWPAEALQLSPLHPGGLAVDTAPSESFAEVTVAAPPGSLERRYVLAQALRILEPGGRLIALAPKSLGGARIAAELASFGCEVHDKARRHHRICTANRPMTTRSLSAAIEAGGPQLAPATGLWSQPGLFSWDRPDPGATLLIEEGLAFHGDGADLGCGLGQLARAALASPAVTMLILVDIDARAIKAAGRNVSDDRAVFVQCDALRPQKSLRNLDFIVMNPPFHAHGRRSHALGAAFIVAAASALRSGGMLRMVANVALPYEAILTRRFSSVREYGRGAGFKVLEAIR